MDSSTDSFMFLVVFMALTGLLLIGGVALFGGDTVAGDSEGIITAIVDDIVETDDDVEKLADSEDVVKDDEVVRKPTKMSELVTISETDSKSAQLLAEENLYGQFDKMYLSDVDRIMDELVAIKNPTYSDERTLYFATKSYYDYSNSLVALFDDGKFSETGKNEYRDVILSSNYSDGTKKAIIADSFDGEMPLTKAEQKALDLEAKKERELEAIEAQKAKEMMKQVFILMGAITSSVIFTSVVHILPKNKNKGLHASLRDSM